MRSNEEHYLQKSMITWFDLQYPKLRLNLFSVPNGANTSKRVGAYMRSEGLRSGVSDLCFFYNSEMIFIEVKILKGWQNDNQKEFESVVLKHGFPYIVIRTLDEFIDLINKILR